MSVAFTESMPGVRDTGSHREAELAALLQAAKTRRAEFEANQQISADVVGMMKAAGIYRALVARRFGGDEVSPSTFLKLIETISAADGSTGWVASFGFSAIYLSALPLATLEDIYANGPDVVFAGGIFPPQKARPIDGGLEVSGRWSWGSGCTGADLIGVQQHIAADNGKLLGLRHRGDQKTSSAIGAERGVRPRGRALCLDTLHPARRTKLVLSHRGLGGPTCSLIFTLVNRPCTPII